MDCLYVLSHVFTSISTEHSEIDIYSWSYTFPISNNTITSQNSEMTPIKKSF